MKVGFIGAGKAGFSLGKYLRMHGTDVSGYYSKHDVSAKQAAEFTNTRAFDSLEQIARHSDFLWITTPDDQIAPVWEELRKLPLAKKCMGHCSGSLSSLVFAGRQEFDAYGVSIHPLAAFCEKEHSYGALADAVFTIEGDQQVLPGLKAWLGEMGNRVQGIETEKKSLYHCAAVTVSNHVTALFESGLAMLAACGFERGQAVQALLPLLHSNCENLTVQGLPNALTGPVERGDSGTILAHLAQLPEPDAALYKNLSKRLLPIAKEKHPDRDYTALQTMMEGWK